MKDSMIAGILLGAVAIFVLISILLYILISYILWRRKPEVDRQIHYLNCLFTCCKTKRKYNRSNNSNGKENAKGAKVGYENKAFSNTEEKVVISTESIATVSYENKSISNNEENVINTESNGKGATVSNEDKSFSNIEENVVINTESVTLEVPRSPIRKSAETYSIVDLNDEADDDICF